MKHTHTHTHTFTHKIVYMQACRFIELCAHTCVYNALPPSPPQNNNNKTEHAHAYIDAHTHTLERQVLKTRLEGSERRAMTAEGREFQIYVAEKQLLVKILFEEVSLKTGFIGSRFYSSSLTSFICSTC